MNEPMEVSDNSRGNAESLASGRVVKFAIDHDMPIRSAVWLGDTLVADSRETLQSILDAVEVFNLVSNKRTH